MTTVTVSETKNIVTVNEDNISVVAVTIQTLATTNQAGLMSPADKQAIDGLPNLVIDAGTFS